MNSDRLQAFATSQEAKTRNSSGVPESSRSSRIASIGPCAGKAVSYSLRGRAVLGSLVCYSNSALQRPARRFPSLRTMMASGRLPRACERRTGAVRRWSCSTIFICAPEDDLAVVGAMAGACLAHRVALVACYRQRRASSALAETLAAWDRAGAALHRLPALSESEIALLIRHRSLAASIALTPNVGDEIARVSCGNPRYVHELFDELLAGAALPQLIPRSAHAAAAALRARIQPAQIDVLELAAVIGERFFDDWLKHASSSGDEAIAATLQTCVDDGLFAELPDPSGAYAFRDLAVCKAIYVGIVGFRRRLLHARVAEMLVASRVDAAYDEIIAEQWHASGKSAGAAEWLARAATQAAAAHRFRDAASLCERAASHAETGSAEWSLVQERAAHYYEQAGLIANALPIRESMLSLLDPADDVDRFATACYALMYDYGFMGWPEKAIDLARSLRGVESPAVRQIVAWAMNSLALGLLHDGFERQSRAALDEARRVEPDVAARPKYVLASAMLRSATTPVEKTIAALASAVELSQKSPGRTRRPMDAR